MGAAPIFRAPVAKATFVLDRGLQWPMYYTVKDAGVLRNLTGYTARLRFLDKLGGTVLLNADNYFAALGASGVVSCKIPESVTESQTWEDGVAVHELEDAGGQTILRVYGPAQIIETGA
jgi:hypothetical protein